jgi:hypothetical protein
MTAEVIARAILVAGSLLLMLGPGLQARLEMSEYHDLLESLVGHDLPEETREYLRLLAIGPSMALHSPLGLVRFLAGPSDWFPQYRSARRAFASSDAAGDERVLQIRIHLTRARNWGIVVLGSVLIFAGATLELIETVITGTSR